MLHKAVTIRFMDSEEEGGQRVRKSLSFLKAKIVGGVLMRHVTCDTSVALKTFPIGYDCP